MPFQRLSKAPEGTAGLRGRSLSGSGLEGLAPSPRIRGAECLPPAARYEDGNGDIYLLNTLQKSRWEATEGGFGLEKEVPVSLTSA